MSRDPAYTPMRSVIAAIVVGSCFVCGPNCLGKTGLKNTDSWKNLRKVTRGRNYTVVPRTGECITGKLGAVKADYLTLKLLKGKQVRVEKRDILRVTTGDEYIVYSGRSSWSDVRTYSSYPTEAVMITTRTTGQRYVGKIASLSNAAVTLSLPGGTVKLAKGRIATLSIISYTPLSYGNDYWAEECFLPPVCMLNVGLWPRVLGYHLRIQVLLYDSSQPEKDSPIACK